MKCQQRNTREKGDAAAGSGGMMFKSMLFKCPVGRTQRAGLQTKIKGFSGCLPHQKAGTPTATSHSREARGGGGGDGCPILVLCRGGGGVGEEVAACPPQQTLHCSLLEVGRNEHQLRTQPPPNEAGHRAPHAPLSCVIVGGRDH